MLALLPCQCFRAGRIIIRLGRPRGCPKGCGPLVMIPGQPSIFWAEFLGTDNAQASLVDGDSTPGKESPVRHFRHFAEVRTELSEICNC
jgi:hypothetical protein